MAFPVCEHLLVGIKRSHIVRKNALIHLSAFTIFCLLSGLGTWQVYRLHWKQQLIHMIHGRELQPPVALASLHFTQPLETYDFQRVTVQGRYLSTSSFHLGPRTFNGQAGYHILQPFQAADRRIIIIDRGWVPVNYNQPEQLPTPQGTLTVMGILRCSPTHTWVTPANQPEKNQWYSVRINEMAQHLKLPLQPCYVALGEKDTTSAFPVPTNTLKILPNRHLEYAVTWYAFALIFALIYWRASVKR